MSYEVIARKWRPRQFCDVVGQEHVTRTLSNAIAGKRLAHAYLFVGPRGIGKTSLARIFAKALNCAEGPTVTPCDRCDSCREIAVGACLDVMEIDGASNNNVEQVRDLRDTVKYLPARGPYKIYIIDEVHMLSNAAFNALLKTLEEPPAHVKFIFATTEPEKILPTILSRCQRFDLKRIPVLAIVERLRLICTEEKVEISDEALFALARASEGGMRDAQSALDQLISFQGAKISEADVLSVFGLVARRALEELAGFVLAGDLGGVFRSVGELDTAGKDLQRASVELVLHFRNLLLVKSLAAGAEALDLPEGAVDCLRSQASACDSARVLRCIEILSDAESRMRYTLSRRALLEVALIRCARVTQAVSLEDILRRIVKLETGAEPEDSMVSSEVRATAAGFVERSADSPGAQIADGAGLVAPSAAAVSVPMEVVPVAGEAKGPVVAKPGKEKVQLDPAAELDALRARWPDLAREVGNLVVVARSALADSVPVGVDSGRVVVGFDAEFSDDLEKVKSPRNRKALEKVLSRELGRPITVEMVIDRAASGARRGVGGPVAGHAGPKADTKAGKATGNLVDSPEVKRVLELFDGKVTDIRW